MVFEIDCESESQEVVGSIEFFEFNQIKGLTGASALRIIIAVMHKCGMVMEFKENGEGKSISAESYLKRVEKKGRWSVPVEAEGLRFTFGQVPSLKHCFVSIEEVNTGTTIFWKDWVESFLIQDGFVQAWVSDVDYDYWQNAKDPLLYELGNRSYAHLPMKSNGLPPPVERMEIDISNNPGRWSLCLGYREAIGSTMWLGKSFWKYVGENCKAAVLSSAWLDVQFIDNDVIQIVASEGCFYDETTEAVQHKLRFVLYGSL
jgi:hypothetical protein